MSVQGDTEAGAPALLVAEGGLRHALPPNTDSIFAKDA